MTTILTNKHRKQARNRMRANLWAVRSAKWRALLNPEVIQAGRGDLQVVSRLSGEELERFRREWNRAMSAVEQSAVFSVGVDTVVSFDIEPDVAAVSVLNRRADGSFKMVASHVVKRKDKA